MTLRTISASLARTLRGAVGLAALFPAMVLAQRASGSGPHEPHRRSVDVALNLAVAKRGGGDWGYVGLSAQFVDTPRRWVLFGAQTGFIAKAPSGDVCYLRPDGGCYDVPDYQWYLSPLVGTGARAGALAVRVFAGPRITISGPISRLGIQANADVTIGGKRVALYIPLTWASMRGTDGIKTRGAGLGLQFR